MHVYLDHAATTPVRPEVFEAIQPLLTRQFGNPSSIHRWGREARALLEQARDQVAAALGASRREIYFTSGGTEADNLAVLGVASGQVGNPAAGRLVVSAVEHKAVLGAAKHAARLGAAVVVVGVDNDGVIDLDALDHALAPTAPTARLVSVMWANNEVGVVQPMADVAARCQRHGALLHTDAVQAFGREDVRVDGIDLLTISGHKIGAPKGTGALYVRSGLELTPLVHGGGQERELRPGTENVAGAVALGLAAQLVVKERAAEAARLRALRDRLEAGLLAAGDARVNGAGAPRLPHITNLSFAGVDQEALLISLDLEGIAVSSGSACQSGTVEPSHVLVAMNRALPGEASVRFSLGRTTTAAEIEFAIGKVAAVVQRLRALATA